MRFYPSSMCRIITQDTLDMTFNIGLYNPQPSALLVAAPNHAEEGAPAKHPPWPSSWTTQPHVHYPCHVRAGLVIKDGQHVVLRPVTCPLHPADGGRHLEEGPLRMGLLRGHVLEVRSQSWKCIFCNLYRINSNRAQRRSCTAQPWLQGPCLTWQVYPR